MKWMALIFGMMGLTGCVAIDEVTFQFHDDSPEAIESNWRDYKRGKVDFSRDDFRLILHILRILPRES